MRCCSRQGSAAGSWGEAMRYPSLVPDTVCQTPIRLVIEQEGLDQDGAPIEALDYSGTCNWQDGGKVELTGEQKYIRITGRAYFNGDICPGLPVISGGYGVVFGERREIAEGVKARNPDGTVNYTEVRFR